MKVNMTVIYVTLVSLLLLSPLGNSVVRAGKIGVLDMSAVYRNYKEVSKSQAYLKEKKDEYQGKIDKDKYKLKEKELAIGSIKEEIRKNGDKYTAEEKKQKENEKRRLVTLWQKEYRTMKTRFEKYKQELEEIERNEFNTIRQKIDAAVQAVARRNRLDMVLEKQWVYYGNTVDVTQMVIDELEGR
jgi:Skp family chaperone for outer membrane proteins